MVVSFTLFMFDLARSGLSQSLSLCAKCKVDISILHTGTLGRGAVGSKHPSCLSFGGTEGKCPFEMQ